MSRQDGGPAFPGEELCLRDNERPPKVQPVAGMSLRDYLASKAMQSLMSMLDRSNIEEAADIPEAAYAAADAMIKERSR